MILGIVYLATNGLTHTDLMDFLFQAWNTTSYQEVSNTISKVYIQCMDKCKLAFNLFYFTISTPPSFVPSCINRYNTQPVISFYLNVDNPSILSPGQARHQRKCKHRRTQHYYLQQKVLRRVQPQPPSIQDKHRTTIQEHLHARGRKEGNHGMVHRPKHMKEVNYYTNHSNLRFVKLVDMTVLPFSFGITFCEVVMMSEYWKSYLKVLTLRQLVSGMKKFIYQLIEGQIYLWCQPASSSLQAQSIPPIIRRSKYNQVELSIRSSRRSKHTQQPSQNGPMSLDTFCSRINFLDLHHLCTSFSIGNVNKSSILDLVHKELRQFHRLLYFDNEPASSHIYPGQSSIFMGCFNSMNIPIVIDSGASKSLSPCRSDFTSFKATTISISGIGSNAEVKGTGTVRWKIYDMKNQVHILETEAYYVPSAGIRLYSPQSHFQEQDSGNLRLDKSGIKLQPPKCSLVLSFPHNNFNNLPMMLVTNDGREMKALHIEEDLANPFYTSALDLTQINPVQVLLPDDVTPTDIDDALETEMMSCLSRDISDATNFNLNSQQAELKGWHEKLNHISFARIQEMMSSTKELDNQETKSALDRPCIIPTKYKRTSTATHPKCAACMLGKMESIPKSTTITHGNTSHSLKKGDLERGSTISSDQYVVSVKGKTLTNSSNDALKYNGGTIYCDHATGKFFNFHQVSLRCGETLVGKRLLERDAHTLGFKVKSILSDNGIYKSKEFRADMERKGQSIHFSGVGAKHQNGIAENAIKIISYWTRAAMIHSAIRWPDQHDLELWPFAFDHSVYVYNNLPSSRDGLAPEEKWTQSKFSSYDHIRKLHPWGCPTYVLDPTLQDGKKLPKWKPRSRLGKFLGYSKEHASSVGLVLNPTTHRVSPQFHVVYDDYFTTVRSVDNADDPVVTEENWEALVNNGRECALDPDDNVHIQPLHSDWDPESPTTNRTPPGHQREIDGRSIAIRGDGTITSPIIIDDPAGSPSEAPSIVTNTPTSTPSEVPVKQELPSPQDTTTMKPELEDLSVDSDNPLLVRPNDVTIQPDPRFYGRGKKRQPHKKLQAMSSAAHLAQGLDDYRFDVSQLQFQGKSSFNTMQASEGALKQKNTGAELDQEFLHNLSWETSINALASSSSTYWAQQFFTSMESYIDPITQTLEDFHPLALAAKALDQDTPSWFEATKGENSDGFWEAMWIEMNTLSELKAWTQVPRSSSMNVIPSTWAYRIKRFPGGLVRKLKARFCVRGDRQEKGIDVFETYAPVVSWTTVRLLLLLSIILNLKSTQVDYTAAFVQAPIDTDVYIHLPQGWQELNRMGMKTPFKAGHVLKLNRSLYGLSQSPRNFFEHLKGNLNKSGFQQSHCDPCLFISDNVICLVYVDDCLFFSNDQSSIDKAIDKIKGCGMDLSVEDDVAGFLGVLIKRGDDGSVELTQTGLISRTIAAMGLEHCNNKHTPAVKEALGQDPRGSPFSNEFSYPSVVGMLQYLANNTRPDITYAVSQCARYTHCPTEKHAMYIKHIGRYLRATQDKGLILRPASKDLHIQCYVDADFGGLWNQEDVEDPHCVRSRTGFIIMVAGCPVIWKSKLQSLTTLSTMESEYVALSDSCRELLPLQNLTKELAQVLHVSEGDKAAIRCTIYEDNEPCLKLANMEVGRITNRSKHIAVRFHWFREHVGINWVIKGISTHDQLADIFTKSLTRETFEKLRKLVMGW